MFNKHVKDYKSAQFFVKKNCHTLITISVRIDLVRIQQNPWEESRNYKMFSEGQGSRQ